MSRNAFLRVASIATLNLWTASRRALAGMVPWLADVQRPPVKQSSNPPQLAPLLVDTDGRPIRNVAAWKIERQRLRKAWMDFLGPMPVERPAIVLEVLTEDHPGGCTRQLVRYESETGQPVEGYLLRPNADIPGKDSKGRRAALVALHQTTNDSIDEIAGVRGPAAQHFGLQLAQRGFVVFCPRCFLWQSARDFTEAVGDFRRRHPNTLGMHKMLWDARRGVDVLQDLSAEVDPHRIGTVGHSLGAKEVLYLTAFDERISAAVASEGGIGFDFTNWNAPWYLGDGIKAEDFKLNHHQLLAFIAPRPFLVIGGESGRGAADGDRTWPYLESAMDVYRLYDGPPRLGLLNHREGHTVSESTFEKIADWLTTYLCAGADDREE